MRKLIATQSVKALLVSFLCSLCALISINDTAMLSGVAHAESGFWALPGSPFAVRIDHQWVTCSAGFPMLDAYGNHYFLTARTCFHNGHDVIENHSYAKKHLDVYSIDQHGHPIEPIGIGYMHPQENSNSFIDIELVKLIPNAKLESIGFSGISGTIPHNATAGQQVCVLGRNLTRPACGKITAINAAIRYKGYGRKTIVNRATYCTTTADIGGAVYDEDGPVGINAGIATNTTTTTHHTCQGTYTPLVTAYHAFTRKIPTLHFA